MLAHALIAQRRKFESLRLAHVDHGLQAASGEWSKHCARQARAWHVPLARLRADIQRKRGESPEAAARDARYALLAAEMRPGEVLVTAQHEDDQAETLLLQLFRGAGVAGLAAMPARAPFGRGTIARPLIGVSRREIERYAAEQRLRWVEDPTNREPQFARNHLRMNIMPLIREHWRGAVAAIARSATHMADADQLLSDVARRDLSRTVDGDGLNVAALRALPRARRGHALRAWIAQSGILAPSTAQTLELGGKLLSARADANPEFRWGNAVIRRRSGRLLLEANSAGQLENPGEFISKSWDWAHEPQCVLNRAGDTLALIDEPSGPIDLDALPTWLEIRARAGGETLRPGRRARAQAVKKLMQAAQLSVEIRARIPFLFDGVGSEGRLVAVGDRWVDASIAGNAKTGRRAKLVWKPRGLS